MAVNGSISTAGRVDRLLMIVSPLKMWALAIADGGRDVGSDTSSTKLFYSIDSRISPNP